MTDTKAAFARGGAGIESLEIRETAVSAPAEGEVLVRLKTATLNFRDLLLLKGGLPGLAKEPDYVPLSCAAGEVVAIGAGVERVVPGDRVNPAFYQKAKSPDSLSRASLGGPVDGVARGYAVFPAESLCKIPDAIGDLQAATLPCAGLTAWCALFGARPLQPGEWVLVQGTGGVSLAALQWAKAASANVLLVSSDNAKLDRARALGADITVNYRTVSDWADEARRLLGERKIDIVVDVAGTQQLAASASLLSEGGSIAAIGMLGGAFSKAEGIDKPIARIAVGNRNQHEAMLAFAAAHNIQPVVDIVYDLEHIKDALHHLESGKFFGKIGINLL